MTRVKVLVWILLQSVVYDVQDYRFSISVSIFCLKSMLPVRHYNILYFLFIWIHKGIKKQHNTFDFLEHDFNGLLLRSFFGPSFIFEHLGSHIFPLHVSCDALDWDHKFKPGWEMLLLPQINFVDIISLDFN